MKKKIITAIIGMIFGCPFSQTYPPQAGEEGSTAIHKDSPLFVDWAKTCTITRGYKDIAQPHLGFATAGASENVIDHANGKIVSLGDGGVAVLTFNKPVKNGTGADFAIFENGFISNFTGRAFLELAFVEVSSDGYNYFRFPSVNQYPPNFVEIAEGDPGGSGFATMDARYLHNFAGKYISNYGTPFDLDEIPDHPDLNKNAITHIKIVDVVGTNKEPHRRYDSLGNIAIDPYPTPFASSGFDLDAVGIIHQAHMLGTEEYAMQSVWVYPNPVIEKLYIRQPEQVQHISVWDTTGKLLISEHKFQGFLDFRSFKKGVYFIKILSTHGKIITEKVLKK